MAGYSRDSWYPPAAATALPPDGRSVDTAARIARLPEPVRDAIHRLVAEAERGLLRATPHAGSA